TISRPRYKSKNTDINKTYTISSIHTYTNNTNNKQNKKSKKTSILFAANKDNITAIKRYQKNHKEGKILTEIKI
ncbi:hypothetical protein, partial [Klebsiella pneumoniae]|uniref:hypothetical protein n=1 Tax=Klebsiella pneumoniae TaxID=573 RepID=UPI0027318562